MIYKENKIIVKKDKEARKLEILEAEVLKRLRDTHVRQQQALEQIQELFNNRSPRPENTKLRSSTDLDNVDNANYSFENHRQLEEFRKPFNEKDSESTPL